VLVAAFTSDGVYEDVTFGLKKKGSAELRELHKFFHASVGGLYVKLISSHVANGYGTIEWIFGGNDVGVFKTGSRSRSVASALLRCAATAFRETSTITMRPRS